jgi:hypothetical protein
LEDSVKVLETYVSQCRDVSLPQPQSIGAIVHGDMVGHDWSLVHNVPGREMMAQVRRTSSYYYIGSSDSRLLSQSGVITVFTYSIAWLVIAGVL